MSESGVSQKKYAIHGLGVELACHVPRLLEPLKDALGEFAVESLAPGSFIRGVIRHYKQSEVVRYLSPTATRLSRPGDLMEIYQENERFWMIDDRWGMCELNLFKAQFRSWVVDQPAFSIGAIVEQAVVWPLAQLLRLRGLCLIPAAAVVRDEWGSLILSRSSVEPELSALVRAGWRVVGQSWVGLGMEHASPVILHMPGMLMRAGQPVDLTAEFCGSSAERGNCNAILIVSPGRRNHADIRAISPTNAPLAIRRAWPMTELLPQRRQGQFHARLAQRCPMFDVQLSRNPAEMLNLLDTARYQRAANLESRKIVA